MASSESTFDFLDAPVESGDLGSLGHYRVIEELGRGGMGYVFRARDKRLHRDVALKVMNQKVAGTPFSRRRFIHEARAMAAVHHDNVATIFEVGEKAGTPFMAMEMLQGSTLETLNGDQRRLGFEQVIAYAEQIARGLAAAHAKGIVHRDIKPANIWIEPEKDRIKILDFGLALAATPVDQMAGRGAVIGTPGYLSPEQARTEPLDDRSDLYSLGVVLYEMCTGCLPLQSSSVIGQLIAILAHRPRPLREINPDIPEPLAALIHRLLYKEPRARIASATALLDELQRVEKACHEKSEVAQTINKLQQGLSAVVSKHSSTFDIADGPVVEVLDPFADIPTAMPLGQAPVTPTPLPATASGSHARLPVTPASYSHPRLPAQPAPVAAWQKYLPLAAVGAVVLIALPVLTFMFTRAGRSTEAVVIAQSPNSADVDSASSSVGQTRAPGQRNAQADRQSTAANNNTAPKAQAAGNNQRRNQNNRGSAANNQAGKNANGNAKAGQSRTGGGGKRPGAGAQASSNPAKPNGGGNVSATNRGGSGKPSQGTPDAAVSSKPAEAVLDANNAKLVTKADSPGADADQARPAESPPVLEAPEIETRIARISTFDGRGADVIVEKGSTEKQGTAPSIAIHSRRGIEVNHSYIRFDLAPVEEVKDELQSVVLVLTFVGHERPDRATIRLYGMPWQPEWPLWQEEGPLTPIWSRSPSDVGLQPLPLLATMNLGGPGAPREQKTGTVSISSPELTEFVRGCKDDTVTLVLAGQSGSRAPLRFISREGSAGDAPTLVIEAPKTASKRKANQRGGGRR